MEVVFLIIGGLAGAVLCYFIVRSKFEKEISDSKIENASAVSDAANANALVKKLTEDLTKERATILNLTREISASQSNTRNSEEKLREQKKEIEELHKTLLTQFENISSKVLRSNSSEFNEQSNLKLQAILAPLKEKIEGFEKKVEDTYEKSLKDNSALQEQIKNLAILNKQISEDALNLTQALKGEKKQQGDWGEMLLETLLERSGLEKGTQYITQTSFENSEGSKFKPDVVICLPDNKHLVIDSKVSLVDYSDYCSCDDDATRIAKLKNHINCIKIHYKELGNKRYDTLYGINSPDYVLMFIPIEPAFTLAMQAEAGLFISALEKNIVLVTSSTLLATLRTVASIWKQENQKKNVLEIAEESGKLYDKFAGFIEDFKTIGDQLEKSKVSYDEALKKLCDGSGNIVKRFEYLKVLGAKTSKTINPKILDKAKD